MQRNKEQIHRRHQRQSAFKYNGRWYPCIRVSALPDEAYMDKFRFNPDTDFTIRVLLSDLNIPTPPRQSRVQFENKKCFVAQVIQDNFDATLVLRKEFTNTKG